ncbi:hypothetical protein [Ruegeria sp. PrR005]|uniref:Uncharacterized protein n=1 Tax=Ruegeria sp. PrR005 TaxID=2706882 RepID=A0A6B2NQC6_9RHOB|nr:hypothetical protein [Ruegeria sp. PrR005]NDW46351.1 hypothetical protein [Ruegeria sp. PrR005]
MTHELGESTTPNTALLDFISDAAAQDDFLALDEIDVNDEYFTKIYACDSNVISLFIDPFSRSTSGGDRRIGSGEVFHSDSKKKKAAIASAIAQFICYELTGSDPLLLIPSVDTEIQLLLQIAARDADTPEAVLERAQELTETLGSGSLQQAEEAARTLSDLIIGATKRKRLFSLRDNNRFASVDDLSRIHSEFLPEVLQILAPMTRVADMIEFSETRERWHRSLIALGRRDDIRLSRDVDAMARLEMWNRRLMCLPQPHRMIYITGDNSLLAASAAFHQIELQEEQARNVFPKNASFREAFFRHPRCFLDRPYVLRPRSGDGDKYAAAQSIRSWLSLLLGEYQDGSRQIGEWSWSEGRFALNDDAASDILSVADKNPDLLEELKETWEEFTDAVELTSLHSGKILEIQDVDSRLRIDTLRRFLNEHMPTFEADLRETWEACVRAFTEARFLIGIVHKQDRIPMRRAPRLCLEGVAPQTFLNAAYIWLRDTQAFTANAFDDEKRRLDEADPSGYNFLVVAAYLLAQGQNWPSAAFLCAHARIIAKQETNGGEQVGLQGSNGREAAYLEAFARRHMARSVSDLAPLLSIVQEAECILEKEVSVHEEHGMQLDAVPERFMGEKLAIEYTRLMLEWYSGTTIDDNEVERVARQYYEFATQLSAEILDQSRSDKHALLKALRQRAYINICSLAIFSGEGFQLRDIGEYAAVQLWDELKDPDADELSLFARVVLYAGLALFGEASIRVDNRRRALDLIAEARRRNRSEELGFVYDAQRYRRFEELLKRGLPLA